MYGRSRVFAAHLPGEFFVFMALRTSGDDPPAARLLVYLGIGPAARRGVFLASKARLIRMGPMSSCCRASAARDAQG
eukprot:g9425.t1